MKKGVVIFLTFAIVLLGMTGCRDKDAGETEGIKGENAPEVLTEAGVRVKKETIVLPEKYGKTEWWMGNYTRNPEGRLEIFLLEWETNKIVYYDLDEDDKWVRNELKNKKIEKRMQLDSSLRHFSCFKRGRDGKLYCIYMSAGRGKEENGKGKVGDPGTKGYLVCLGEDGMEFRKYLLEYCNSGDIELNRNMIEDYDITEDGRALIRYENRHSELYSMKEERVVRAFSEKTSKYSLFYVNGDIYRAGEYWMSMDVVDEQTEESIRTYEHNFKHLSGYGTYKMAGCGDLVYLLDGNGIHFMDTGKDGTFQTIEPTTAENHFDTNRSIEGFETDGNGNLYVAYVDIPENREEIANAPTVCVRYTLTEG